LRAYFDGSPFFFCGQLYFVEKEDETPIKAGLSIREGFFIAHAI
jgi:hypothetical protein